MRNETILKHSPFFLVTAVIIACYYPIIHGVGFLIDDWNLLESTATNNFWMPVESHHWSLMINSLFHITNIEWINPKTFHVLAITGHLINVFLVYAIVHHQLHLPKQSAWVVAALFGISPAGSEALIWCCAIGYVYCALWVLAGIYVYLRYLNGDHCSLTALLLLMIQVMAFLTWDWAVLFVPTLAVAALLHPSKKTVQHKFLVLLPSLICTLGILYTKKWLGLSMGYHFNSLGKILGSLALSPLPCLIPQMAKPFYTSPFGITVGAALLVFLGRTAVTIPVSRIPIALFFLWQIPAALFGHPQSRYCYLPAFTLLLAIVIGFNTKKQWKNVVLLGIMVLYITWTVERIGYWIDSSNLRDTIQQELVKMIDPTTKEIVIVNLPSTYAPKPIIWKPFTWGVDIFRVAPNATLVEGRNRSEIEKKFPNTPILEVQIDSNFRPLKVNILSW